MSLQAAVTLITLAVTPCSVNSSLVAGPVLAGPILAIVVDVPRAICYLVHKLDAQFYNDQEPTLG